MPTARSTARLVLPAILGFALASFLPPAQARPADAPAAVQAYDAGAVVALAIAKAGSGDPAAIKAAIPQIVAADGEPIYAGKDEFAKALGLIKAGKPIKYEGVIGPISFDQYGDITGPFRLWKITDGKVTTVGTMSADDVDKLKASLK